MIIFVPELIFRTMISGYDISIFKGAALILRAINNDLRQSMLRVIAELPGINVTDLYGKLEIEQSVASQHLAILRHAGLVKTERKGKSISYFVDEDNLKEIYALSESLTKFNH